MDEYERLEEMRKYAGFKESPYSAEDIEREEAYLIYEGRARRNSYTGEFIYTGFPEMGS